MATRCHQQGEGFNVHGMGLRGSHVRRDGGWGEAQLGLADPMSGEGAVVVARE